MTRYFLVLIVFIPFFLLAQQGKVTGLVTDAITNEGIPFANVVVDGTQNGTFTDNDGKFEFINLTPGYIKLVVSYIGYETTISQDVMVTNNTIPYIEIRIEEAKNELNEVTISVNYQDKKDIAPISMLSIGTKQIESNPGSNRDISRVIQSFPGVGSTPAFRNDIIIRGGGPSENRFFLDEVETPIINHFATQGASGGPVGIVNADFIRSVDFYSGSFPSDKYNALSGVMDFKLKDGSKDKTNLQATLGASETGLTLDGPIGEKTSYIFSVRRSYLQFLFKAIGLPFLPTYNDYQFKLKTNIDSKNTFTLISLGSLDQLSLNKDIDDPSVSQQYQLAQIPVNNQWSYTIGGVYKHFSEKGSHTVVLSRNMLNNEFYKFPDNDESKMKTFDYLSQEIENKLRYKYEFNQSGWKYSIGANSEFAKYNNDTKQQIFLNDTIINFQYNSEFNMLKYGLSGQLTKRFFDEDLLVNVGLRMDGNNYNADMANVFNQLSPRFSLSYSLLENAKLNMGVGRYFQLPAYTTLGYRNNQGSLVNEDIAQYIGVDHYNLGVEYNFKKPITISLEGFYKNYFQYPIDLRSGASLANQGAGYSTIYGATPVSFNGGGKAYGFEVLNRINFSSFNLLASYTYVRSEFTDITDTYIPSSWDSKHLLTITGSNQFKNNWRAGFKWRYVGGLPYTPYDLVTSANVEAWNANGQPYFDFNGLNAERFEAFHQLDIRVDKNFFFNKWSLMLYLDIQNLYNFQNKGQDYIIRSKNDDGSFQFSDDGQNYILESVPNEGGTILPTIGVIVKI